MKIASFNVELQSSRQFSQSFEMSERLEVWRGNAALPETRQDGVNISAAGRAAQLADAATADTQAADSASLDDAAENDPKLSMLIRMIEFLTGKPVQRFSARDLERLRAADAELSPGAAGGAAGSQGAGFGMAYDFSATYAESETTSFAAAGVVRTADGAEIRFELGFTMSRSYSETVSASLRFGEPRVKDPLVLDFGGPASALSDLRFEFDLDGDGSKEQLPMVGGSGFLAFDRNANGRIDDGRELFGPASGDGFGELAALDDDGNGWIDESDAAWSQLRVWQPDAQGPGRLQTLKEAGVGAFYLGRVDTPFSLRNAANETLGEMRASSIYLREDGRAGTVNQIDLAV